MMVSYPCQEMYWITNRTMTVRDLHSFLYSCREACQRVISGGESFPFFCIFIYCSSRISLAYATTPIPNLDSRSNKEQWFLYSIVHLEQSNFPISPSDKGQSTELTDWACILAHSAACCYRCPGLNGNRSYLSIMCSWFRMQTSQWKNKKCIKVAF